MTLGVKQPRSRGFSWTRQRGSLGGEAGLDFSLFSFTLQAAVVLNDILPSLGSMGHWLDDTHIQQVWTVKFHDKTVLLGKLSILLICMDIHIPLAPVVFANVLV